MNYSEIFEDRVNQVEESYASQDAQSVLQKISQTIKSVFLGTKKIVSDKIIISNLKKDGLFWLIREELVAQGVQLDPYSEQGQYILDMCRKTTQCLHQTAKIYSEKAKELELSDAQRLQLCNYLVEYCDYGLLSLLDTETLLSVYEYKDIVLSLVEEIKNETVEKIKSGTALDAYYSPSNQICENQYSYYQKTFVSDKLFKIFPEWKGYIKEGEYCKNTPLLLEKLSDYYIGQSKNQSVEYRQFVADFFESLALRNTVRTFENIDKVTKYFTNPDSFPAYCHFKQIHLDDLESKNYQIVEPKSEKKNFEPNPEALKSLDYMLRKVGDGIAQIFNSADLGQITSQKIFDVFFDQGEKKRTIKTQYADALKHWLGDRWNDENKMYALIHHSVSKLSENNSGKFAVIGTNPSDFVTKYWNKKYNAGLAGVQLSKKKKEYGVVSLAGKPSYYPFKAIYYGDKTLIKKA